MPGPPVREAGTDPDGDDPSPNDRNWIFTAKGLRAAAYGALSGFLVLYLTQDLGYSTLFALLVTTFSLVGAALWNLVVLPPLESKVGRRRALMAFGALFVVSAAVLFLTDNPYAIVTAVLLGGVGASTADNGPLASLEQAILPSAVERTRRIQNFAWYNLVANFAAAAGGLLLVVPTVLEPTRLPLPGAPHPWMLFAYLLLAAGCWVAYFGVSWRVDVTPTINREKDELPAEARHWVRDLMVLFGVDSFAGGLVVNPVVVAFFLLVWHANVVEIGILISAASTAAGLSFLAASALADRFGLLRTMVFTHIPSNVLLILVPLMPTFPLAFAMFVARTSLSQMDVPTRQAYSMALVARRFRARVAGRLSASRSLPQSLAPFAATALVGAGLIASPFYVSGVLKLGYDLSLWRQFRRVRPPEEEVRPDSVATEPTTSWASLPRD